MKKLLALILLALTFTCFAAEPAGTVWVGGLSITQIFVGDYNIGQGRVMFSCAGTDQTYWFDLTYAYGRAMHSQLLTAYTMGKRISVLRNPTPSYATEYQVYRVIIYD